MKIKNVKKGFTLLELLAVVLIIGILSAIALPQYQMAVGKARFSELKTTTKAFQQAAQRYYMINGKYSGINEHVNEVLDVKLPRGGGCRIWSKQNVQEMVRCCKQIFQTNMCLYINRESGLPAICYVGSSNKNNNANKLCRKETGKKGSCSSTDGGYCSYSY